MPTKPVIGITPTPVVQELGHGTFYRYALSDGYTKAIEAAGGIPLIIPPQSDNVDQLIQIIDGLLLSGGGDIRPDCYGDTAVHEKTYGISDERDQLELALTEAALAQDMPVFGICRGIQVLNVALGGTLIQDVADQFSETVQHRQQDDNIQADQPGHEVTINPGTLLEQVYGESTISVNSFHHQALKDIAPDLRMNAIAADGLVEAIDHPHKSWVLGVQWHPEMMFQTHPEQLKPFAALVEACLQAALTRS